jgi:hypothetical protein
MFLCFKVFTFAQFFFNFHFIETLKRSNFLTIPVVDHGFLDENVIFSKITQKASIHLIDHGLIFELLRYIKFYKILTKKHILIKFTSKLLISERQSFIESLTTLIVSKRLSISFILKDVSIKDP